MNPQQEAQVADYVTFALVAFTPQIVSIVNDMAYPWWLWLANLVLAWKVSGKVYRHVIDDHLRLARERAAQEEK